MNYAAVRAVSMQNLNRQRANMVLSTFFDSGTALTPNEVSNQERIFEWGGVLRWKGSAPMAKAKIGCPLQEMISSLGPTHSITGATRDVDSVLVRLFQIYAKEEYLLWYSLSDRTVYLVLKEQSSVRSQLKAWTQGLVLVHRLAQVQFATCATEKLLESVESSLLEVSNCWPTCMERLNAVGWDLDIASLETASGTRIKMDTKSWSSSEQLWRIPFTFQASKPGPDHGSRLRRLASVGNPVFYTHTHPQFHKAYLWVRNFESRLLVTVTQKLEWIMLPFVGHENVWIQLSTAGMSSNQLYPRVQMRQGDLTEPHQ